MDQFKYYCWYLLVPFTYKYSFNYRRFICSPPWNITTLCTIAWQSALNSSTILYWLELHLPAISSKSICNKTMCYYNSNLTLRSKLLPVVLTNSRTNKYNYNKKCSQITFCFRRKLILHESSFSSSFLFTFFQLFVFFPAWLAASPSAPPSPFIWFSFCVMKVMVNMKVEAKDHNTIRIFLILIS